MRSKGPLQREGSRPAPRPGEEPPDDPDGQDQLAEGDARGSGGVSRPPVFQCVLIPEVQETLEMMVEEATDLKSLMRARL